MLLKEYKLAYTALILVFRAARERTLTEKTCMFILLIKLLSLIHLCHLRLFKVI